MNIIWKRLDQGVEIYVTQYVFTILYCYILTAFILLIYSNAVQLLCCYGFITFAERLLIDMFLTHFVYSVWLR